MKELETTTDSVAAILDLVRTALTAMSLVSEDSYGPYLATRDVFEAN